jgi:predicted Zn finger-like uncharacterized protein
VYTQCPDCTTVFRVTAEVLRAAQGKVRCGVCARSFNALENLSEEPFQAEAGPADARPEDSMTVEELPGGEDIELSSANEIQALPEPLPEDALPERPVEPPAPSSPVTEGASLEFHGDAGDLDRLFVVQEGTLAEFDPAMIAARPTADDSPAANDEPLRARADDDLERTDEYPIIVLEERDEPDGPVAEEVVLESEPQPAQASLDSPTSAYTAPRILIPEEMRQRLAQEAAVRATAVPDFGPPEDAAGGPRWPWVATAAALLVVFAAQVVHRERLSLAQRPGIGPLLAQAYGFLGLTLSPPTDLAAYELRQWGAASDPGQQGRLLLRASIVNRAAFAQPFPLLRLALQDRFGATLGVRDIEPGDYLPGETSSKLLGPGERADAEIRIVDPGQEAVGFEMDVCLPVDGGVRCANQITTAAQ